MKEEKKNLHKDEGALRIMEALSAVDEDLLERSGMPVVEVVEGKRNSMPVAEAGEGKRSDEKVTDMSSYKKGSWKFWRYGRLAAACLAIVAVGAVSWGGLRLTRMITGDNSSPEFSGGAQINEATANQGAAQETTTGGGMYSDEGVTNEKGNGAEASRTEATIDLNTSTEEQARDSKLGAYIPRMLPAGYSFENAQTDDRGQLYLCWTSGMDTIRISVTCVEAGELETVDISRPETYDVRLYELPYGETVPREYWTVFDNPVFLEEDFSFEAVASRMKSCQDAKDTDIPGGRFSILYPDGILVGFDGCGSAEDIWTMFASRQE